MQRSKRGYKRKDVFSNPRAQVKIVLVFAGLALLFITTNYQVVQRLFADLSNNLTRLPLLPENRADIVLLLQQQEQMLDLQLAILAFLAVFVLLTGGVLLSHRIGGPLYQMKKYFDELNAGTASPRRLRFRKYDFFHDLAESFNRFQENKGILTPDDAGAREGPKQ